MLIGQFLKANFIGFRIRSVNKTNFEPKSVFMGFFLNSSITKSLLIESNLAQCAAISARLFNLLSVIVGHLEDNDNFN